MCYDGNGDDNEYLQVAEETYSEASKVGSRVMTVTMPLSDDVYEMAELVAKNWQDYVSIE